jgi:hypothetical protein
MDISNLKPFHGYQSSIIPLTSGHYFYLASWDSTPTQIPRLSNVWFVTPENKRILFADPSASSEIVCIYHQFDEIYGASINLEWTSPMDLQIGCQSTQGDYNLKATFKLPQSLASRLLVAIGGGPPTRLNTSKVVLTASNFLLNLLVARGGATLLGRTETGQLFYNGHTDSLFQVLSGSVSLNGESLGTVTNPTWPIEFGDATPFYNPVLRLGTLYIPFEHDLIHEPDQR